MSGTGWPSHDEDEKARIARCYTDVDQPTGCPLCIVRAEADRLRERLNQFEAYAITVASDLALRAENERTKKDAERAYEDLGNILYNIETGEWREAELQVREVRDLLDRALAARDGGK